MREYETTDLPSSGWEEKGWRPIASGTAADQPGTPPKSKGGASDPSKSNATTQNTTASK